MMDMCERRGAYLSKDSAYGSSYNQQMNMLYGKSMPQGVTLHRGMNSHNNFLAQTGHTITNNFSTSFEIPPHYSQVVVYLVSDNVTLKRQYNLSTSKQATLNMTHEVLEDVSATQGWTMSREIYSLTSKKSHQISRNCTWTTVSKNNVIEYAKTRGYTLPEYLTQWSSYTHGKKLETYDKHFCH